jgi:hypothetical protein
MTPTPRQIAAPLLVAFALSGCATFAPTPQQQSARAAWDRCPKTANLALTSIDPNGFVRYRAMSGPAGTRELAECLSSTGVSSTVVVAAAP